MDFEFYWADYLRFGSDHSLMALSRFLSLELKDKYGSGINNIFICGHCSTLTPPNEENRNLFANFEEETAKLRKSPKISLLKKKHELNIRYATVWPVAEEFRPDSEILKLGTFKRFYLKVQTLLNLASDKLIGKVDFDFAGILSDIKELEPKIPKKFEDLAALYITDLNRWREKKT